MTDVRTPPVPPRSWGDQPRGRSAPQVTLSVGLFGLAAATSSWVTVRASGVLLADYFLVAAIVVGVIESLGRRRRMLGASAQLPLAAIGLIAIGGVIGPFITGRSDLSPAVQGAAPFVLATALSVLAAQVAVTRRSQLERCARLFVVGVTISAVVGLATGASSAGRIGGLGGHPNHVGLTCMLAFLLVAFAPDLLSRPLQIGIGGVLLVALVQTGSRAALLGLAVGVLAGIVLSPTDLGGKARVVAILGLSGLLVLAVFPQTLEASGFQRLRGVETSGSDAARAEKLEVASSEILASPLFGQGLAGSRTAHSVPVQIWVASGAFGVAGILALARFGQVGLRRVRRRTVPLGPALGAGVIALATSLMVANQFWDRYIWVYVALFTVALRLEGGPSRAAAGRPAPPPR